MNIALNLLCSKNNKISTFSEKVHFLVNQLNGSLNLTVMTDISPKLIKIFHEKAIKGRNFCLFHKDTSNKDKSLNGHVNEPRLIRNTRDII